MSDENHGRLTELGPHGDRLQVLDDPNGPEGVIALRDGRLVVAEQNTDRIVVIRPPSTTPEMLLQLQPVAGVKGVDGIALDAPRKRLLVPDSARGTLLAESLAGGTPSVVATNLGRPVAAAVGPDGAIYVAAENRPGLLRVPADGGAAIPAGQNQLDEVITVGGLLYVASLGDFTVNAIDPATGNSRTLVTGDMTPQGLTLLSDGRLAVSDLNRGVVFTTPHC